MLKLSPEGRSPSSPPTFARLVLWLIGVVWLGVGVTGLAHPVWLAGTVDFELPTTLARFEFRAMYGGLSLALAGVHFFGTTRRHWLAPTLRLAGILMLGLFAARVLSIAVEGFPGIIGLALISLEATGLGLVVLALRRLRSEGREEASSPPTRGTTAEPPPGDSPQRA